MIVLVLIVVSLICINDISKKKEFTQAAVKYIQENFPFLELNSIIEGDMLTTPQINATAKSPSAPIQSLYIREKVENKGKHNDTDTMINAVLLMPETHEYGNFIITIKKEGIFSRMFFGENVILGISEIDDKLLIRSDRPEIARVVLNRYLDFLHNLIMKGDLEECRIQAYHELSFVR